MFEIKREKRAVAEVILIVLFIAVFLWSAWAPNDRFTWYLEIFPAVLGAAVLVLTYRRFRFTTLVYVLIFLHAAILLVGGHYTYAEVPLFNWLKQILHQSRNNYDKLGHLAQGFIPAMIAREILLRCSPLRPGKLTGFIVLSICLAISASYEIFEAAVSIALSSTNGESVEAFLGMQGDIWDTQSDMLCAALGAASALLLLAKTHDRALDRLTC